MTRKRMILSIGYFPKEVPPQFHTAEFAGYACSKAGRTTLAGLASLKSRPFYEGADFTIAEPDNSHRNLELIHPVSCAALVDVVTKNYLALHEGAHSSQISRSKPVYSTQRRRAISPQHSFDGITDEKQKVRAGYGWLLRADVSQFYPSLYTHALGWAITPRLRERANWSDGKLLGNKIDKAVRETRARRSQGIPIGNDIAFLLGEVVLSRIDGELSLEGNRAVRWFDDYEIACATRTEAEQTLAELRQVLADFSLRLNPKKTEIIPLPQPVQPAWKRDIRAAASRYLDQSSCQLNEYFDAVFSVQNEHHTSAALKYALGHLFRTIPKTHREGLLAQSAVSQCVVTESGCAQKALALLTHWCLEGMQLDQEIARRTVHAVVTTAAHRGVSSDTAWLLSFCAQNRVVLGRSTARVLDDFDDGLVTLMALHLREQSLLPEYGARPLKKKSKAVDLDGRDWLLFYEAHRRQYIPQSTIVGSHALFSELDRHNVSFFQDSIPTDAFLTRPGGAPDFVIDKVLHATRQSADRSVPVPQRSPLNPFSALTSRIRDRIGQISKPTTAELYEAMQRSSAPSRSSADEDDEEERDDELDDKFADDEDDGSGY